ncbi:hypothetical protein [Candidatus Absconditicoccus praedator]|uniref:hypothetical protein n=1 Tax=Candidatus Absconditicoccus praedator TaxID=2735562 RepID=UPI001E478ABB|nr:hypothetical protein [Candidatus Absconditicoccus praedator]UFX83426.1 hypothetical protein HLG78_04835 [Candidatus Absconditicoccus praedator]
MIEDKNYIQKLVEQKDIEGLKREWQTIVNIKSQIVDALSTCSKRRQKDFKTLEELEKKQRQITQALNELEPKSKTSH